MKRLERKGTATCLSLLIVFILTMTVPISSQAFAHGPPPGGCAMYYGTEYQSEIVSFRVSNGLQEYDVLNAPGSIVQIGRDEEFTVKFTLRADPFGYSVGSGAESGQIANPDGFAWYRDNANGYPFSKCAGPLKGGGEYEITQDYPVSYMFQGEGPHLVFFETSLDDSRPKAVFYLQIVDSQAQIPALDDLGAQNGSQYGSDQFAQSLLKGPSNITGVAGDEGASAGSVLTINGRIASVLPVSNNTDPAVPVQILTGNWSMSVNNTSVYDFTANITSVGVNGTGRQYYELDNFTAINSSSVRFNNTEISLDSNITAHSEQGSANTSIAVTLEGLSAVRFDMTAESPTGIGPIYGVVDTLIVTNDGQVIRTITR